MEGQQTPLRRDLFQTTLLASLCHFSRRVHLSTLGFRTALDILAEMETESISNQALLQTIHWLPKDNDVKHQYAGAVANFNQSKRILGFQFTLARFIGLVFSPLLLLPLLLNVTPTITTVPRSNHLATPVLLLRHIVDYYFILFFIFVRFARISIRFLWTSFIFLLLPCLRLMLLHVASTLFSFVFAVLDSTQLSYLEATCPSTWFWMTNWHWTLLSLWSQSLCDLLSSMFPISNYRFSFPSTSSDLSRVKLLLI